jgi:hypothetical protein
LLRDIAQELEWINGVRAWFGHFPECFVDVANRDCAMLLKLN